MQTKLTYQDLIPVLAIGRAGSLAGAARELGVDHSTIFRRLGAIEQRLAVRLFDRGRSGYRPTAAGISLIQLAARFEQEMIETERVIAGQDAHLSGPLKVTTCNTLTDVLVPVCLDFGKRYPEISIELIVGGHFLDLAKREADVAIRPTRSPPEDLHGRRMGWMTFSIYGSRDDQAVLSVGELLGERWVGFSEDFAHIPAHTWMKTHVPRHNVVLSASSMLAVASAVESGAGLAILPCHFGDAHPGLQRRFGPVPEVATDFWLLVHDNMRRAARVRAFTDFAYTEFQKLRPIFETS